MAIKIVSFDNFTPIDGDYPYGDIKDNNGTGNGTSLNRLQMADMYQFFAKMADTALVTLNDLPDNVTNGFQFWEALVGDWVALSTVATAGTGWDISGIQIKINGVGLIQIVGQASYVGGGGGGARTIATFTNSHYNSVVNYPLVGTTANGGTTTTTPVAINITGSTIALAYTADVVSGNTYYFTGVYSNI